MALPKLDVPIYELYLPLSKKTVRHRPFLVKEEKLLLMAMESNDEKTVADSIKQIINNCCLDDINVDDLPVLDFEFFFLNLRARSIGEITNLKYKCNNDVQDENNEEKKCNNIVEIEVNILDIKPEIDEGHTNKIELSHNMGLVMKYPNFSTVQNINENTEIENIMKVILSCIEYIYDEDQIYYKKDIGDKELLEFVENLTHDQFMKVQNFFETLPKIKKQLNFKCNKCKFEEKIIVEGIQNFFV